MTQITDNNLPVTYSFNNPASVIEFAKQLQDFVKSMQLTTNIQGKQYVNVEGWQYAGSQLGLVAIVTSTRDLSNDKEIKYEASAKIVSLQTDKEVGFGVAICSNKEQKKKSFDEYAINSMAQTRSIGKAYRLALGWLMKAAGYEATPAEEMDFTNVADAIRKGITKSGSVEDLNMLLETYPEFKELTPVFQLYQDKLSKIAPILATEEQKQQIKDLLENECILDVDRAKMLNSLDKLTEQKASGAIVKIKARIAECEAQKPVN